MCLYTPDNFLSGLEEGPINCEYANISKYNFNFYHSRGDFLLSTVYKFY